MFRDRGEEGWRRSFSVTMQSESPPPRSCPSAAAVSHQHHPVSARGKHAASPVAGSWEHAGRCRWARWPW
eukprot:748976-Hanusia_phi.AAC.2